MNHSEAIILNKRPLGEADLLITLFTRDAGKVKGVAKHAKRSKKRFAGVLETGYVIDLTFKTSPGRELVRIDDANLRAPLSHISKSIEETTALWLALELADRFLPAAEGSTQKYELLSRFVKALHEGRLTRPIFIYFLFKWIEYCGFLPEITEELVGVNYKFKTESVKILKKVMSGDLSCDINDAVLGDSLEFVFYYTAAILGKPLRLQEYLEVLMDIG